jgi:hypothetical protein
MNEYSFYPEGIHGGKIWVKLQRHHRTQFYLKGALATILTKQIMFWKWVNSFKIMK